MTRCVIGLSGRARSGKNTVADILTSHLGFEQFAFADLLRDMAAGINPMVDRDQLTNAPIYYLDLIADIGYTEAKKHPEVRRLLQRLGTEGGRLVLGDSFWVDACWNAIDKSGAERVVLVDSRFGNEAQSVKDRGGYVWRVERPGCSAALGHVSETALDDWDFDAYIHNDSSKADLVTKVLRCYVDQSLQLVS